MSFKFKKRSKKEILKDIVENIACLIVLAITLVVMVTARNKLDNQSEPQISSASVEIVRIQED